MGVPIPIGQVCTTEIASPTLIVPSALRQAASSGARHLARPLTPRANRAPARGEKGRLFVLSAVTLFLCCQLLLNLGQQGTVAF
jgi:hypothetical protein